MAASRADQAILAVEPTFQNRVRQSLVAASISIANEGWTVGSIHRQREQRASAILNSPDSFKPLYAIAAATDATLSLMRRRAARLC